MSGRRHTSSNTEKSQGKLNLKNGVYSVSTQKSHDTAKYTRNSNENDAQRMSVFLVNFPKCGRFPFYIYRDI